MHHKTSNIEEDAVCEPSEACVSRGGPAVPVKGPALAALYERLEGEWKLVDEHHLHREFRFKDFQDALEFTNQVGALSDAQCHPSDVRLASSKAEITLYTPEAGGLTEGDFILARKINALRDDHDPGRS